MRMILALASSLVVSLAACSQSSSDPGANDPARKGTALALAEAPADVPCAACNGADTIVDDPRVHALEVGTSPVRGPASAPVTIVAFSDFECAYCAKSEATLRQLEARYGNKVRFVFKNAPLPMHPHARLAAKAALAAGEQGKFWPYHDALFADEGALDQAGLERVAAQLSLDLPRFRRALASQELEDRVEADLAEARRLEVKGTPAFFVNGRNLQGAQPLAAFEARIDQALAERR